MVFSKTSVLACGTLSQTIELIKIWTWHMDYAGLSSTAEILAIIRTQ